jgi:ABC-type transporter lipoprotein component MlaA
LHHRAAAHRRSAREVNRKVYKFNDTLDKAIIRPVAVGYRNVTNAPVRRRSMTFFTTIRMPITVANDLLQARPKQAVQSTGRFLVNLTIGLRWLVRSSQPVRHAAGRQRLRHHAGALGTCRRATI